MSIKFGSHGSQTFLSWASSKAQTQYCTQHINRPQIELALQTTLRVFFAEILPGENEIDLSSLP
jgi:hypothetical protein